MRTASFAAYFLNNQYSLAHTPIVAHFDAHDRRHKQSFVCANIPSLEPNAIYSTKYAKLHCVAGSKVISGHTKLFQMPLPRSGDFTYFGVSSPAPYHRFAELESFLCHCNTVAACKLHCVHASSI